MIRIEVDLEDRGVIEGMKLLPNIMAWNLFEEAERHLPQWKNGLRMKLINVVYVTSPVEYQQNYKLLRAVAGEVTINAKATEKVVEVFLFNDTALVQPTDPKPMVEGGPPPRPEEIPWQIEQGNYPTYWLGTTAPRPAYTLYARDLEVFLPDIVDKNIEETLKKF